MTRYLQYLHTLFCHVITKLEVNKNTQSIIYSSCYCNSPILPFHNFTQKISTGKFAMHLINMWVGKNCFDVFFMSLIAYIFVLAARQIDIVFLDYSYHYYLGPSNLGEKYLGFSVVTN